MKNGLNKKILELVISPLAALTLSSTAMCGVSDFQLVKAVVDNATTEQIVHKYAGNGELVGVEKTQTYRCEGCYEFALRYRTIVGTQYKDSKIRLAVVANSKGDVAVQEISLAGY